MTARELLDARAEVLAQPICGLIWECQQVLKEFKRIYHGVRSSSVDAETLVCIELVTVIEAELAKAMEDNQ